MSTALALQIDVQGEAPSAYSMAEAARLGRVATVRGHNAWDHAKWGRPRASETLVRAHRLPGFSALLAHWEPLHRAGERPGSEFRERLVSRWPSGSYEREILDRQLAEARALDQKLLVRHELKNLAREREAAASSGETHFYDVLQAALLDLKGMESRRNVGFLVHPDTLERAKWTMHELMVFIEAHWALRKTHLELAELKQKRMNAVRRLAGCLHGPGGMADGHDELE